MASIKRNYFYNLSYQILTIILPIIITPYVSRVLGAYNIGINSFVNSIVSYFALFASLGTAYYGKREIARFRDDKEKFSQIFWEIEIMSIVSTLFTLTIWILFISLQEKFRLFYIILTANIVSVSFDITWLFAGLEKFESIVRKNLIVKLISLILIFACVNKPEDIYLYIIITSGSTIVGNVSMWILLKKLIFLPEFRNIHLKAHFKQTLIYFLPTIATTIYTYMDKTMLQIITDNLYENGYYEQAVKICRIPLTVLLSMDTVMSSRMSYLVEKQAKEEVKIRLNLSIKIVGFIGIPMVFGINLIIKQFVPWFLGPGYDSVVPLVYLYSPLILCIGINNCLSEQYLTPCGKRKQTAGIVIISAILNFVLNMLLIPKFKASGASFASVISEAFIAISYMIMCKRVVSYKNYFSYFWKNIIASSFMAGVIFVISYGWNPGIACTLFQIIFGLLIYILILAALKDDCLNKLISVLLKREG